ncbi:MAG: 23S rRNA (guanosine(2251)-2'-O)-methyltransferase RlmB [Deltaproteobacteria bacterium]|nr:23S rRNA (guanosine(2251)-2'-O)-methyltransferase RlmB [Deltaproteobacteria bacterium]
MTGHEVLYGMHPVFEALRADRRSIHTLYLGPENRSGRGLQIRKLAQSGSIAIRELPNTKLSDLTQTDEHQGVAAEVSPYPISDTGPLRQIDKHDVSPTILVADQIVDPRNLGALIRTAMAVGINCVITPKDRCAPPTPLVSKSSAGALEHVHLIRVTNLVRTLTMLKDQGAWVYGLDQRAKADIYGTDWSGAIILVVGGEQRGLRPLVKKHCDHLVSIPQQGGVASLNASVAGAVAMYEIFRQKRFRGP